MTDWGAQRDRPWEAHSWAQCLAVSQCPEHRTLLSLPQIEEAHQLEQYRLISLPLASYIGEAQSIRWQRPSQLSKESAGHISKYLIETIDISPPNRFIRRFPQKSDVIADTSQFILISIWDQLSTYFNIIHWIRERGSQQTSAKWLADSSFSLSGTMTCQQMSVVGFLGNFCFPEIDAAPFSSLFLKGHKIDGRNCSSHSMIVTKRTRESRRFLHWLCWNKSQ